MSAVFFLEILEPFGILSFQDPTPAPPPVIALLRHAELAVNFSDVVVIGGHPVGSSQLAHDLSRGRLRCCKTWPVSLLKTMGIKRTRTTAEQEESGHAIFSHVVFTNEPLPRGDMLNNGAIVEDFAVIGLFAIESVEGVGASLAG